MPAMLPQQPDNPRQRAVCPFGELVRVRDVYATGGVLRAYRSRTATVLATLKYAVVQPI
jgi:hypothetical protein